MGKGLPTWNDIVNDSRIKVKPRDRHNVLAGLTSLGPIGTLGTLNLHNQALLERLLEWVPCLITQLNLSSTAKGIVHLCEITLGTPIVSANVYDAFVIQNPSDTTKTFSIPPQRLYGSAGDVSEALCCEVLINEGIPQLEIDSAGWPVFNQNGYISLNKGKMSQVKAFGDILIPCAPSNLIISVKTQAAKERLLYSANMIEGIGFGFFNTANEFWTPSRMNLFKRMGFTAIYLPDQTYRNIISRLTARGILSLATNVNGKDLYRPMSNFGQDMKGVIGRHSLHL